jgi:NitT/TauT family transport system substrate-binding protein
MRKRSLVALSLAGALVLALAATGCGGSSKKSSGGGAKKTSRAAPINMSFSTWIGYAPIVVGQKKGLFKKEGVKVSYTLIEDPVQRFAAFKARRLDGIASTVDTYARTAAKGVPSKVVLGLDASVGGDGIVAKKDISSVAQLKGEKVAVSEGSTSEWLLAYVLDKHGMSLDDVEKVDMTSGDAGAAFAAGRVPVAVTWEPWLSRAESNPDGHVLASTKQGPYRTIIVDAVAFQPDFVTDHADSVKAFLRGYDDAIKFIASNPSQAYPIIAKYIQGKVPDVKAQLATVRLLTIADNKKFFGTESAKGPIYQTFDGAAKFWKRIGETSSTANASSVIDPAFVNGFGSG